MKIETGIIRFYLAHGIGLGACFQGLKLCKMKNDLNSSFLSSLTTSLNTFYYVLHNNKNRGVAPNTL